MNYDPFDIVKQSFQAVQTHNELLAAQAVIDRMTKQGDLLAACLKDLAEVSGNATDKAVILTAVERWNKIKSDRP